MQINIDHKLLKCPTCGEDLNLKKPTEKGLTVCSSSNCDYTEVAGSPWYVTYAGLLLKTYLEDIHHVNDAKLIGSTIPTHYLFNPRGLLHIFLAKTKEVIDLELMNTPLQTMRFDYVKDESAVFKVRVVVCMDNKDSEFADIAEGLIHNVLVTNNIIAETLDNSSKFNNKHTFIVEDIPDWNSRIKELFPNNTPTNSRSHGM